MIYGVKADNVRVIWPDIYNMVQDALDHGESLTRASTIFDALESRDMQLYVVSKDKEIDAVFITEITNYDDAKVCIVVVLAGTGLDKWLSQVEDTICRFAKSHDCEYVQLKGRRGWVKELKKYGWKESSVTMAKEL